jgi:hypothetical protein
MPVPKGRQTETLDAAGKQGNRADAAAAMGGGSRLKGQGEQYVRRHAKASSAGSNIDQGARHGFLHPASGAHPALPGATRSGASSIALRLALLALSAIALFLIPASQAFAEVIVNLNGTGTGSVVSNPAGIECSNTGPGVPGPTCGTEFPFDEAGVKLTPTPSSDSFFAGWAGDDPVGGLSGPTCNEGAAVPCSVIDLGEIGEPPIHITATFKALPDPPLVTTGGSGGGADEHLINIEGVVNPVEFKVSSCRFELGPTTKYGESKPCVPGASELGEGSADEPVSAEVETEELKPTTTYHYRLTASNLGGTGRGEDRTFTTTAAPADSCPNASIRDTQALGAILLPDCMGLEMVSPPQKGGQPALAQSVSANAERVRFVSVAALAGTPGGLGIGGDQYIASRGSSDWTTQATSPTVDIVRGSNNVEALSFTPDLSDWFQLGSTQAQYQVGISQAFRGGLGGVFSPLSSPLVPLAGGEKEDTEFSRLQGASADHSHLFFVPGPLSDPTTAYLPGDPEPTGGAADHNTYVARLDANGQPSLELLSRDRSDKVWGGSCGARLGGIRPSVRDEPAKPNGERSQGAVSSDGSRVYFSTRPTQPQAGICDSATNKLRILERLESQQGPWVGELFSSECNRALPAPCKDISGDDYYQGASSDGSRVYFTTNRQLASSDLDEGPDCSAVLGGSKGCDLYLYDAKAPPGQRLIQVSAGAGAPTPGEGADVFKGVTAISGDGSHVYFVAQGILTTGSNPRGAAPVAGQPNLYVWDRGTEATSFIGALDSSDGGALWGEKGLSPGLLPVPELGRNAEGDQVGGDGHILAFPSKAPLVAGDSDGTHTDVFRYDADTEELVRVTKAVPGGDDDGAFDIGDGVNFASLGTDYAEARRHVSEDGKTVVFTTVAGLVPGDVNGTIDYYLWREGKLYRLPGVVNVFNATLALSHDGSTVAFTTTSSLLPQDGDASPDAYIVRAGGGFPVPPESSICVPNGGEGCQGPGGATPAAPNPGSANLTGPGNPKSTGCPKGKRRVKGRCVSKHRGRHHRGHKKQARQGTSTRHANTDRRAAK